MLLRLAWISTATKIPSTSDVNTAKISWILRRRLMPCTATAQPSAANRSANALPKPRPAPVTSATRPANDCSTMPCPLCQKVVVNDGRDCVAAGCHFPAWVSRTGRRFAKVKLNTADSLEVRLFRKPNFSPRCVGSQADWQQLSYRRSKPDSPVLKLRSFGFPPQRGNPKEPRKNNLSNFFFVAPWIPHQFDDVKLK